MDKKNIILIIEDNPGDYVLLNEFLNSSTLNIGMVLHAEQLGDVASIIDSHEIDVVLLDLSLPDSDGVESCRIVDELLPHTPIIVLTGVTDQEIALQTIACGAQDYLIKGEFDELLLDKTIHYSIERKKIIDALIETTTRYSFVSKATHDVIWEWDLSTDTVFWGEGFHEAYGHPENAIANAQSVSGKYIHADDDTRVMDKLTLHLAQKLSYWEDEYRFRCADGSYRYVYNRGLILYKRDVPVKMYGAIADITEKKELEKELAEQQLNQQKLIAEVGVLAQENERNDIGRELHDNINQILATAKLSLGIGKSQQPISAEFVNQGFSALELAMVEIRKLSHALVAPPLETIELDRAIQDLIDEVGEAYGVTIQFNYGLNNGVIRDEKMKLTIYRIIQEQLNNIRKHAAASLAIINISHDGQKVDLEISDNGRGFNPTTNTRGIGLRNIQNRIKFYGGSFHITSMPGEGCTLRVIIPD